MELKKLSEDYLNDQIELLDKQINIWNKQKEIYLKELERRGFKVKIKTCN